MLYNICMSMRGSRSTAKLPIEFLVNTLFPFMEKVCPPPYCCAVVLDSRLHEQLDIPLLLLINYHIKKTVHVIKLIAFLWNRIISWFNWRKTKRVEDMVDIIVHLALWWTWTWLDKSFFYFMEWNTLFMI